MNLAQNLERSAFFFPRNPAICTDTSEYSYGEFNELANRVATSLLKTGMNPGDHVALCAPNSPLWLAFFFGILKAGGVAVPVSPLLKKGELEIIIGHSKPVIVYSVEENLEFFHEFRKSGLLKKIISPGGDLAPEMFMESGTSTFKAVERERTDTAVILYTGGTTGEPKGVMLSHANINAAIYGIVYNERSTEKDRALCFLPFNHVFGLMHIMNATVLSAGCLELLDAFDLDRVLSLMEKLRVTKFFAVPTIYVRMLELDRLRERLGSVRYSFSAAASMAAEHVVQWKERTGMSIYEGYGMTEAAPTVSYNHHYRHKIGSVGTEVPHVEIQIRDDSGNSLESGGVGEICVRGPNIMKGYLDSPVMTREAFWKGGWFRTGDVGRFDEEGYLYIVDRIKEMIITGGENVYPREVEEVLYSLPEVRECAVIGLPDREWGEKVTAFIVPKNGVEFNRERIKSYLKERIAPFKVPKDIREVDDFPKSQAGKILKRKLKEIALDM